MDDLIKLATNQLPALGIGVAVAATTTGVAYYLKNRSPPIKTMVPLNDQSIPAKVRVHGRVS